MSNNPLFSILMPCYNVEKYIADSIDSILKQTYTNWEIIIVEDCSSDNTRQELEKYKKNEKIKIFYNEKNMGAGFSYFKAGNKALGEISGILDSDDTLNTEFAIENMVNYHLQYKDYGMICSRHNICNDNMKVLWISPTKIQTDNISYLTDQQHNSEHFITFKMDVYRMVGSIKSEYKNAIDQDLYYRFEEKSKIMFVSDILYNYRINETGLTHKNFKNIFWHIKAITEACNRRDLNPENVVNKLIQQIIEPYDSRYKKTINSKSYKLGNALLAPIFKIRSLITGK